MDMCVCVDMHTAHLLEGKENGKRMTKDRAGYPMRVLSAGRGSKRAVSPG